MPITDPPWTAWFDKDEEGRIYQAGVDTADRAVNIGLTTCENIEIEDKDEYNAIVIADTWLFAAAPELLAAVKRILDALDNHGKPDQTVPVHFYPETLAKMRAAVAKAERTDTEGGMPYVLCKYCDHFVEENDGRPDDPYKARYLHIDDGDAEYDHGASPGVEHTRDEWKQLRPDLFVTHPDGKIGPNSVHHHYRGPKEPTLDDEIGAS